MKHDFKPTNLLLRYFRNDSPHGIRRTLFRISKVLLALMIACGIGTLWASVSSYSPVAGGGGSGML